MTKETYYVTKETYYVTKETYYMTKETYYMRRLTRTSGLRRNIHLCTYVIYVYNMYTERRQGSGYQV
jgi:hypothetical protein